jgi:hypothetical protein
VITSDTPETDNERTLKLALEVFTKLANTLKQERDEAREKYDKLRYIAEMAIEYVGHTSVQKKLSAEFDQLKEGAK